MLVYDITKRSTFEHLTKWLNDIDLYKKRVENDGQKIMLIGNKADLDCRNVSYKEGVEFARKERMLFFETSAKTGVNINEAFADLVQELLKFVRLQDAFEKFRQSTNLTDMATTRRTTGCCLFSASTPKQPKLTPITLQTPDSSPKRSGRFGVTSSMNTRHENPSTPCEFSHIFMHISYC